MLFFFSFFMTTLIPVFDHVKIGLQRDINQHDFKIESLTSILSNVNNFHSLEVVDRVSETQFQVSENSN